MFFKIVVLGACLVGVWLLFRTLRRLRTDAPVPPDPSGKAPARPTSDLVKCPDCGVWHAAGQTCVCKKTTRENTF